MDCVWRIQNDMKVVSSLVLCLSFQNKGTVRSVNDQVVSMVTTLQYIYNRYNLENICKKRFWYPLYYQSSLSQSHKRTRAPLQFSLTPPTYYPVPRVDNFHHGESLLRYIEPLYLTLASEIRAPMIYVPSVSRRIFFFIKIYLFKASLREIARLLVPAYKTLSLGFPKSILLCCHEYSCWLQIVL